MNPPNPPQPDYAALNTAFGNIRQSLLAISAECTTLEACFSTVQQEVGRMANQPTNVLLSQQIQALRRQTQDGATRHAAQVTASRANAEARVENMRVITLTAPLSPIVHEDTNQDFATWLGAHANQNYGAQAGTWLFPADVNALNGLRSRRHIRALCEFLQIPQGIWPAVAPNIANASVAERNLILPVFRTKLGLSPV
ncbi:uncharacterized protein K441DRAFT_681491 [Cenococcum geophilum 1.58]|uniref:uncharacterized protein n=1 Tax=Cenococcum geophilum 1.58 TaxID=794803 RepID=UPI00358F680A|nr:hypothetical protein K441DRAFT_681491 [Cenococcum geophilum 1.58]